MKKLYFLIAMLIQTGLCIADNNPGNFQVRLVSPGGEPGVMRVQYRCINASALPTTGNFCHDLGFVIYWNHPLVVDIDAVQSTSIGAHLNEGSPVPGSQSGALPNTGTVVPVGFCANTCGGFVFPTNWVLNQWVNVASINICSVMNCTDPSGAPSGVTAADFSIQSFVFQYPNMGVDGVDYTPASGPLPLNLISFNAKKSGEKDSYISWTTANEENTSHFIVQRSFDKNTWTDVGSVGAAGYSIDVRNYELNDLNVNSSRTSRLQVYYRLKMFDLDGKNSLSPIQSVVFNNGSSTKVNEFLVYPNPSSDGIQVEWDADNLDQPTSLEFYDIAGKLIYKQTVSDNTNQEYIDFGHTNIQSGLYLLRIMSGDEAIEHKQIVVSQNR